MKTCIIFCAGEWDGLAQTIGPEDIVIAADGGLRHALALGIQPDVILGDFDSLDYVPEGAQIFPVEKDETDTLLAIQEGLCRGCDTFYLYGALDGPRLDHTIANLQCLYYLAQRGAIGYLVGRHQIIRSLHNEDLVFPAHFQGIFSVFCLGYPVHRLEIRGAKYSVKNVTMIPDYPLGVSNQFQGEPVTLSLGLGTLIVMWDRKNGLA